MGFGTKSKEELLHEQQGARVRECREMRGLTREELVEQIELLPENGSAPRSEKQIYYIERGDRPMSAEYSRLLSKALNVREQYLLCEDDYKTQSDIFASIAKTKTSKRELIENLLTLHGYLIEDITEQQPIMTDEKGRQYRKPLFAFVSPHGTRCYFTEKQLAAFIQQIDNYVEMSAMFLFRKLEGAAPAKPKRGER